MIEIKVRLSENSSPEERSRLHIEEDAIREFLGNGYAECTYEAEVVHNFPPRAISPDQIEFFIQLGEIAGAAVAFSSVAKAIKAFIMKTKGYRFDIRISGELHGKDVEIMASGVRQSDVSAVLDKLEKEVFYDLDEDTESKKE